MAFALTLGTFALPAVESGVCLADKFAISASAYDYGDYEYNELDDGTLEISWYNCDSSNKKITIPSSINGKKVTSIGDSAFINSSNLTSVTIPNSVTSIGDSAFYNCSSLTSITIPSSVRIIKYGAFDSCVSLTNITIPASVTSIGYLAFNCCDNLKSINVDSNNKYYSSKDGVLFDKNQTTIIFFPSGSTKTSYTIPNGVKSIEKKSFDGCSNLRNITIPNSVTSIGSSAFNYCENLTNITIPNSVTSIGSEAFFYCASLTKVTIPNSVTSIGSDAFFGCASLTNVTIPNSIKSIGNSVFGYCFNLTSVTIPNSVISIGEGTFYFCSNLTSVTIPNGVTNIGDYAFLYCDNLKDVYYKGTAAEWKKISIGSDNSCLKNATIHYVSQKNISSCTISLPTATQYFRGTRIRPVVTVKDGTKTLKSGTDYTVTYANNLSVGKAAITITGKGSYKGTVTKNFNIVQRSIGNCDIKLGSDSYYFNNTEIKPSVKVYCNGTEMYSGNYTISYSNNIAAGTATVTLTGKKNLCGTVKKTFKIKPRSIGNCTVSFDTNYSDKYQPYVNVMIGSYWISTSNYTVKYTTSADKKTVKVTITGKGNLAGTTTKTYTVA